MASDLLRATPQVVADLRAFRSEPKFQDSGIYHAPSEAMRISATAPLDALLDRLIADFPSQPTKAFVLGEFRRTLAQTDLPDSEERDLLCAYLERIMDIVGIDSSDGLLNEWRYGFDPRAKP